MKPQDSTYTGFINNYIAGNLEANSTELNLHSSKINDLLRELEAEIKKGGFKNSDKLCNNIRNIVIDNNGANSETEYKKLGQNLMGFVSLLQEENGKEIPSYSSFLIKKIIYHFLNIAKTSRLSDIERTGMEIAEKYNSVWKN